MIGPSSELREKDPRFISQLFYRGQRQKRRVRWRKMIRKPEKQLRKSFQRQARVENGDRKPGNNKKIIQHSRTFLLGWKMVHGHQRLDGSDAGRATEVLGSSPACSDQTGSYQRKSHRTSQSESKFIYSGADLEPSKFRKKAVLGSQCFGIRTSEATMKRSMISRQFN